MRHGSDMSGQFDSADVALVLADMRRPRHERALPAIQSRLRDFQKRSFPGTANAGRGKKARFDLEELVHLACAFELVDVDLSTARCIDVVSGSAPVLTHAALIAWAMHRAKENDRPYSRMLAYVLPTSTTHSSGAIVAFDEGDHYPRQDHWPGRRSRIAVDLTAMTGDLVDALEGDSFRMHASEVDEAFRALAKARLGHSNPGQWPVFRPDTRDDRVLR